MNLTTVIRFGCCAAMGLLLSYNNIHYNNNSFWAILFTFMIYGLACYFDGKASR
jgi:hypothetical protein